MFCDELHRGQNLDHRSAPGSNGCIRIFVGAMRACALVLEIAPSSDGHLNLTAQACVFVGSGHGPRIDIVQDDSTLFFDA